MFNASALTTTIKPPRWSEHWSSDQTTQRCSCSACCLCRKWWGWEGRCVLSLSHTGVQTLLFSLCSFKESGSACDSHATALELPRSVQERPAALPDLLRYSDIKDELFHFLSVKPFMHPHTFHWCSSQDERWWAQDTSCSVRGHTGSHPVGEESQVATQCVGGKQAGGPIPASQSTSSWWSYKVLIIKTCQCVVWWYQSWTLMVQHSAGTVRTWSSRSAHPFLVWKPCCLSHIYPSRVSLYHLLSALHATPARFLLGPRGDGPDNRDPLYTDRHNKLSKLMHWLAVAAALSQLEHSNQFCNSDTAPQVRPSPASPWLQNLHIDGNRGRSSFYICWWLSPVMILNDTPSLLIVDFH